jgi:hypothetical protein
LEALIIANPSASGMSAILLEQAVRTSAGEALVKNMLRDFNTLAECQYPLSSTPAST